MVHFVKNENILCLRFVMLFVEIDAYMVVYVQYNKRDFVELMGTWTTPAQLLQLGPVLRILDTRQRGSVKRLDELTLMDQDLSIPLDNSTINIVPWHHHPLLQFSDLLMVDTNLFSLLELFLHELVHFTISFKAFDRWSNASVIACLITR